MGISPIVAGRAPIHKFYSSKSWIEGDATRQLEDVASLPGVIAVAGMPDIHPGKYGPVGCSILANAIHPALVGSDIGCGMALFALDLPVRKIRVDRAAERLRTIECPWDGDFAGALAEAGLPPSAHDSAIGTIGGGNHFCELQALDKILSPEAAATAGLDRDRAYLLVHSGSRGLGYAVLENEMARGLKPLAPDSEAGEAYQRAHDHALAWAVLNRHVIAARAAQALRCKARLICDQPHNFIECGCGGVLHRKGAAPSDRGFVPAPGSRGSLSYLLAPAAPTPTEALTSLSHGAGRKYDRGSMAARVGRTKSERDQLTRNPFGGQVICEDRALLVEEAPDAYKPIERVVGDLEEFGLARAIAAFRPLVTLKRVATPDARERKETRR